MVRTKERRMRERRGSEKTRVNMEPIFVSGEKQWCIYKVLGCYKKNTVIKNQLLRFTWFVASTLVKIFKNFAIAGN